MFNLIYLRNRFFIVFALAIGILILAYTFPILFNIGRGLLVLLIVLIIIDGYLLKIAASKIHFSRSLNDKLSLGDSQIVEYIIDNNLRDHYILNLLMNFQRNYNIEIRNIRAY